MLVTKVIVEDKWTKKQLSKAFDSIAEARTFIENCKEQSCLQWTRIKVPVPEEDIKSGLDIAPDMAVIVNRLLRSAQNIYEHKYHKDNYNNLKKWVQGNLLTSTEKLEEMSEKFYNP